MADVMELMHKDVSIFFVFHVEGQIAFACSFDTECKFEFIINLSLIRSDLSDRDYLLLLILFGLGRQDAVFIDDGKATHESINHDLSILAACWDLTIQLVVILCWLELLETNLGMDLVDGHL